MPTRFWGFFFYFLFGSLVSWAEPASCGEAYQKLNHLIERNFFETRRTFEKYVELFPDEFSDALSRLDETGHWLDAGSGEAFAVQDFFRAVPLDAEAFIKDMQRSVWKAREVRVNPEQIRSVGELLASREPSKRPQVTAISFSMERSDPGLERLKIQTGRFFEQIPSSEIKPVDIITDLFGVASYSPRIDEVLKKYHQVLKPGGKAFIFLGDYIEVPRVVGFRRPEPVGEAGWDSAFSSSQVVTAQGQKVSLLDWVQSIPGLKATVIGREVEGRKQPGTQPAIVRRSTLVLERVSDQVKVPRLKLIEATDDKPPIRVFQEISLPEN